MLLGWLRHDSAFGRVMARGGSSVAGVPVTVFSRGQRMSLIESKSSFLTLRPSIRETDDTLVVKTSFLIALLTLCLNTRRVEVSMADRTVTFLSRVCWFFTSRHVVPFNEVAYIDYEYKSMGTSWGFTGSSWLGRQDQIETFAIAVVSQDGQKHHVCSFRGEGSVCTGWSGVLLGDDSVVDFSGTQQSESLKLVDYLAALLETRIGQPTQTSTQMATCPACGQQTSPFKPTCLYCGAALNTAD